MDVHYSEFIRSVRTVARGGGFSGVPSHGGALQSVMRMMTSPGMKQDRMWWVTEDLEVGSRGEVLYFVGCLPYFEGLFKPDFGFAPTDIARATVRLLNAAGIQPVVDPNERCCGHDLYWSGDDENFKILVERNVAAIRETGASVVVTACAECAATLRDVYPQWAGPLDFEVKHLSEWIADRGGQLAFKATTEKVTFQDPCRLGRHMGVFDAPRQALGLVPGLEILEMLHSGRNATCCGTSAWMNCDQTSKQIQMERIGEAKATGSSRLVTACPKCQIHLRCAISQGQSAGETAIEIQDLSTFLASCL
jgi:Fe-S oxidoreductase